MALSLPLILFLSDWLRRRTFTKKVFIEKILCFIYIAPIAWVTYAPHARIPFDNVSEAPLIWVWTSVFYIRQFIFPLALIPIYQLPRPVTLFHGEYVFSILIFILLIVFLYVLRKNRWLIWAFLFYFLSIFFLLRFDSYSDVSIVADRFMYLPSVGFCVIFGLFIGHLLNGLQNKNFIVRIIAGLCGILFISGLVFKTFYQCKIWNDSPSFWQYELHYYPNSVVALNNLAIAYGRRDAYQKAVKNYKRTMQKTNDPSQVSSDDLANINQVIWLLQKALRLRPSNTYALNNLADAYRELGRLKEAEKLLKTAIAMNTKQKELFYNLGRVYEDGGDYPEAIGYYKQALKIDSSYREALICAFDLSLLIKDDINAEMYYHQNKRFGYEIPQGNIELLRQIILHQE